MAGVLEGIRIVEMAGIGPGPFAGMMLADHGADVVRVERIGGTPTPIAGSDKGDILSRSRTTIQVDLKSPAGRAFVIDLAKGADGLIEGYRPGVMERLGLGPEPLLAANPALIYGRMTGWGQDGPKSALAGHDINYLAVAGTLHMLGRAGEPPTAPANLVGDYGGGGLLLAFGMCAGLLNAARTGIGQVIDCAMVDGAAILASALWSMHAQGLWQDQRGVNMLDGGAHFYDTYEAADGKFIAVGAIEPQFYRLLRDAAGIDDPAFDAQFDAAAWPDLKLRAAAIFATRTRDEWCRLCLQMGVAPCAVGCREREHRCTWSGMFGRAEIGVRCQTSTVIVTLSYLDTIAARDDLWPVRW